MSDSDAQSAEEINPTVIHNRFEFHQPSIAEALAARQSRQRGSSLLSFLWNYDAFVATLPPLQGLIGDHSKRRLLAAVSDLLLALIGSMFLVIALPDFDPLWKGLSYYLFFLLYYQLTEYFLQATPGKWWFALRVKSINGNRPSFWQILIRTLLRVIELSPIFLGVIPGAYLVRFTRRHVRLGDILAGTVVARIENL